MMNKFGELNDFINQQNKIRLLAKQLRQLRPKVKTDWKEPADWVVKDSNIKGKPARTLSITLTPTGCAWAHEGGCTMCGEYEGSTKGDIVEPQFHIAQFASAISKYVPKYKPSWLRIYQEGNYANQKEIHKFAQSTILQLASLINGIERITIESMAKYLSESRIEYLKNSISGTTELEIGMGFEAKNDVVRNVCVNKGENINVFKEALKLLKKFGVLSVAYVILKPPFLTEKESIDEAIETINFADQIGFDAVSLEPVSIHAYSLVHALNSAGLYKTPWLWSVLEVAKNVKHIRDLRIGGSGFYPRPLRVAHNPPLKGHEECNKKTWNAIKEYGRTRNYKVFDGLNCECKQEWEKYCQITKGPLQERIEQQLRLFDFEDYKIKMKK